MKIIISPAKKMKSDTDCFEFKNFPIFLEKARKLKNILSSMTYDELKALWKCSDSLAELNYERLKTMDLSSGLSPALFSYEGIQYTYMAPSVFSYDELEYIENHLYILSGFYGILRPFDGVTPYRLEMQAKLSGRDFKSLYEFWGSKPAKIITANDDTIINLASAEYSRLISSNISEIRFITCYFGEMINGKFKEKGTACKMARGSMVRYMAENKIEDIEKIKDFSLMGYVFNEEMSTENKFVFINKKAAE